MWINYGLVYQAGSVAWQKAPLIVIQADEMISSVCELGSIDSEFDNSQVLEAVTRQCHWRSQRTRPLGQIINWVRSVRNISRFE